MRPTPLSGVATVIAGSAAALLLLAGRAHGFETGATIRRIDRDRRSIDVLVGGQPHTLSIAADARFLGADGKPLPAGLSSPEWRERATVTLTVEPGEHGPVLKAIRLGGLPAGGGPPAAEPSRPEPPDGAVMQGRARLRAVDPERRRVTLELGGSERTVPTTGTVRVLDASGKELAGGLNSPELKPGISVLVEAERGSEGPVLRQIRIAGPGPQPTREIPHFDSSGLMPLTELGEARYQGFEGGLYPGGKNERPAAHEALGRQLARQVQPLGPGGKPAADGRIVLLTVGMSNTAQASTAFLRLANADPEKNPQVTLVNGAQGGMTAFLIQNPDDGGSGTRYWTTVDERLRAAGVTRAQVQAVWIKQADAHPTQGFPGYARTLQAELARCVQAMPARFPNLKLVYLSSRTYGGWARSPLNPEPYAYESGFSVKWLVEQQIRNESSLNPDPAKGPVRAPWLSWGPYLWANGSRPRADGFAAQPSDFAEDGTHESAAGQEKVGTQLLRFFKSDSTTRPWFVRR